MSEANYYVWLGLVCLIVAEKYGSEWELTDDNDMVSCSLSGHWLVTFKTQIAPVISWLIHSLPKVNGWLAEELWLALFCDQWLCFYSWCCVFLAAEYESVCRGSIWSVVYCTTLFVTTVDTAVMLNDVILADCVNFDLFSHQLSSASQLFNVYNPRFLSITIFIGKKRAFVCTYVFAVAWNNC